MWLQVQTARTGIQSIALFRVPFNRCLSTSTIHDNQPAEQAIVTEWGKLLQRSIDRAIGHWRRRLVWVVPQQSEQIEHLM